MKVSELIKVLQAIEADGLGNLEVRSRTDCGFEVIDPPAIFHLWKGDRKRLWLPNGGEINKGKKVLIL